MGLFRKPVMDMNALAKASIPLGTPASSTVSAAASTAATTTAATATAAAATQKPKLGTRIFNWFSDLPTNARYLREDAGAFVQESKKWGSAIASPVTVPVKKGLKYGGIGAAVLAGIGGMAYLTSQSRKARAFDPRTEPLPESATPEMPAVLTADAMMESAAPERSKREVLGPMTAKVLGRTGGLDVTPPNTVGGDGASLIDGKKVADLGAPSLS